MEIVDRLSKLAGYYLQEARRCKKNRGFFAASVMEVAALEAVLQSMCFIYSNEIRKTTTFAKKKFRRKRYKALDFSLFELIKIAEELNWFPNKKIAWAGMRKNLIGYLHETRGIRNLIHPGEWARQRSLPLKIYKGTYLFVNETVDVVNSLLLRRVNSEILKSLKKGSA